MAISTDHVDSDSAHSPSDDEKKIGLTQGEFHTLGHGQLPPDPDAHLSLEERAAIVRCDCPDLSTLPFHFLAKISSIRTANFSGKSTSAW